MNKIQLSSSPPPPPSAATEPQTRKVHSLPLPHPPHAWPPHAWPSSYPLTPRSHQGYKYLVASAPGPGGHLPRVRAGNSQKSETPHHLEPMANLETPKTRRNPPRLSPRRSKSTRCHGLTEPPEALHRFPGPLKKDSRTHAGHFVPARWKQGDEVLAGVCICVSGSLRTPCAERTAHGNAVFKSRLLGDDPRKHACVGVDKPSNTRASGCWTPAGDRYPVSVLRGMGSVYECSNDECIKIFAPLLLY
jgi:hypothetical protein